MNASPAGADTGPTPLVSVVIPFFNRAAFLAETVKSVLAQSVDSWELLLVDDGSTDGSAAVARAFVRQRPECVRLLAQPDNCNRGAAAARNLGREKAGGTYLLFLDADDVLLPDALEKQLAASAAMPAADAICGTAQAWFSWAGADGGWKRDFVIDLLLAPGRLYDPPALLLHNLNAGGRKPFFGCTLLRRRMIDEIGGFEEAFGSVGEDQVLWAKVSLHGRILITDECLMRYRQHADSVSARGLNSRAEHDRWVAFLAWLAEYARRTGGDDAAVATAMRRFRRRLTVRQRLRALQCLYRRLLPLRLRYRIRDFLYTCGAR